MSLSQQKNLLCIAIITMLMATSSVRGFVPPAFCQNKVLKETQLNSYQDSYDSDISRRKMIMSGFLSFSAILASTTPVAAKYVLNDDGDYEEVSEEDWQTVWKQRLDKANNMSTDEIFAAARGAGNLDLKEGDESDASKKRRAMSACRDSGLRTKAGVPDVKACNTRVMDGDFEFILPK